MKDVPLLDDQQKQWGQLISISIVDIDTQARWLGGRVHTDRLFGV